MKKIYTLAAAASLIAVTAVGQQPLVRTHNAQLSRITNFDAIEGLKASKHSDNQKAGNAVNVVYETDVVASEWTVTTDPSTNTDAVFVLEEAYDIEPSTLYQRDTTFLEILAGNISGDAALYTYWDDNVLGTCIGIKDAILTTFTNPDPWASIKTQAALNNPITVTPGANLSILFDQLHIPFNSDITRILVKENAGDAWTAIAIDANQGTAGNTVAPLSVAQSISSFTSTMSQTTLYIGFEFDVPNDGTAGSGCYGWFIDNIKVIEEPESDIAVSSVHNSDLNSNNLDDNFQLGYIPLHAAPDSLTFTAVINNIATLTQDVDVLVELVNGGTVFASNTKTVNIAPGEVTPGTEATIIEGKLVVVKVATPQAINAYTVRVTATPSTPDQLPNDNVLNGAINITEALVAPFRAGESAGTFIISAAEQLQQRSRGFFAKLPTNSVIDSVRAYIPDDDVLPTGGIQQILNIYFVPDATDLSDGLDLDAEATLLFGPKDDIFVPETSYGSYVGISVPDLIIDAQYAKENGYIYVAMTNPGDQAFPLAGRGQNLGGNSTTSNRGTSTSDNVHILTAIQADIALFANAPVGIVKNAEKLNFSLGQNVPNPFNGTSTISYNLVDASTVNLNVYDLTGKQVFTTGSKVETAGAHTVTIDAANFNAGIYYYTLNVNGQSLTKKMIVTK